MKAAAVLEPRRQAFHHGSGDRRECGSPRIVGRHKTLDDETAVRTVVSSSRFNGQTEEAVAETAGLQVRLDPCQPGASQWPRASRLRRSRLCTPAHGIAVIA